MPAFATRFLRAATLDAWLARQFAALEVDVRVGSTAILEIFGVACPCFVFGERVCGSCAHVGRMATGEASTILASTASEGPRTWDMSFSVSFSSFHSNKFLWKVT